MTKEQIANLHIGDEIWLAKFKLGYDTTTHKITTFLDYHPKKFAIKHYICDADFNIVGFVTLDGCYRMDVDAMCLLDNDISKHLKYATCEKEITEWYENHKRAEKEQYMKQLEEATKELGEI